MKDLEDTCSQHQLGELLTALIERSEIWRLDLLDERHLDRYCHERGLMRSAMGQRIRQLWHLGWLHADIIISPSPLDWPGLLLVETTHSGSEVYADQRILQHRPGGWADAIRDLPDLPEGIELRFHPFRYYVMYAIGQLRRLRSSPIQILLGADGYQKFADFTTERFAELSSQPSFADKLNSYNSTAALAIATEPCFFELLFGRVRLSLSLGLSAHHDKVKEHWSIIQLAYQGLGLHTIEKLRMHLCIAAERLDPNKDLHTVLRLTRGDWRLTAIKGYIGGSLCLLTMAELLRRAAEQTFDQSLPEEDELGFGFPLPGAKAKVYGSARLVDDDIRVRNQFLRRFGLDCGVRLRWYVEGDTEYRALQSVIGSYSAIQLVNLRGQFVASGGKGLSFRDDLDNDLQAEIFSFVLLDGDRSDCARAARKAVEDDVICGMIYTSKPDFEFANLTLSELATVAASICATHGVPTPDPDSLDVSLKGAQTADEFLTAFNSVLPPGSAIHKGREWGEALMKFILAHPQWKNPTTGELEDRPVVYAIDRAKESLSADYRATRKAVRVDPTTGRPVKRETERPITPSR